MRYSLTDDQPEGPVQADVAIVGAGLAGLVLAQRLAADGVSVAILESGPVRQDEEVHPLNQVEQAAQEYRGAAEGRARGLGGTSTRWGGALLPYLGYDLQPHPGGWHQGWNLPTAELDEFLASIENDFGVASGSYEGGGDARYLPSFEPRLPKWPLFKNRSTANIYRKQIESDPAINIWTDATVTDLRIGDGRVSGIVAKSSAGHSLEVNAKHVAITAGAIETTRLLLLFDRAQDQRLFPAESPLGKGFHDHLSAPIARLEITDRNALSRLFGFRFVPGGMRNLRFELSPEARAAKNRPAAFLHVAFTSTEDSGFAGLRRVYQAAQKAKLPAPGDLIDIARDLPWFLRAGWWRFTKKRVLAPPQSEFELHLVTEQEPVLDNTIGLSNGLNDRFGLPLARVDWRVHDQDIEHFHAIASLAIGEWSEGPLADLAKPVPRLEADIRQELAGCGGIYHPAGTTRIGANATEGVVDSDLRVYGVPGLWAIATSVFPSIGGTSPSLGLMQFAARAARQISAEVRQGG